MTKTKLDQIIEDITKQLIKRYKPEKIILFGSATKGQFKPDSDLDFLIVKKNVPQYGYQRMNQVRKLIKKKVPADFLVYQSEEFQRLVDSGEPFLQVILKEGKLLYG